MNSATILLFGLITVLFAELPCSAANLVPNGDFEQGARGSPAHWTSPDNLTSFWSNDGVDGRCIRFDTDVYREEWEAHRETPEKPVRKTPTRGKKYNTVAGSAGVKMWSEPIRVEPGGIYRMQADVKGPGGEPFVYLKGFRRCSAREAERRGTLRFFHRNPKGPAFSLMVGGDEKRPAREGDYLQVFRKRLVCRVPKSGNWRRFSQPVQIPDNRYRATVIMLMLYAYWPPGDYYFDNIVFRRIDKAEAAKIRRNRRNDGVPVP